MKKLVLIAGLIILVLALYTVNRYIQSKALPYRITTYSINNIFQPYAFSQDSTQFAVSYSLDRESYLINVISLPSLKIIAKSQHNSPPISLVNGSNGKWRVAIRNHISEMNDVPINSGERAFYEILFASVAENSSETSYIAQLDMPLEGVFDETGSYFLLGGYRLFEPEHYEQRNYWQKLSLDSSSINVYENGPETFKSIDFSKDGRYFAMGSEEWTVEIRAMHDASLLKRFEFDNGLIGIKKDIEDYSHVLFSPDGKYLAVYCSENPFRIIDIQAKSVVAELEDAVHSACFSSNNRTIYLAVMNRKTEVSWVEILKCNMPDLVCEHKSRPVFADALVIRHCAKTGRVYAATKHYYEKNAKLSQVQIYDDDSISLESRIQMNSSSVDDFQISNDGKYLAARCSQIYEANENIIWWQEVALWKLRK